MLSKQRANVLTSKISRNDFLLSYMGFLLIFFSRVVKKNTFKNDCINISIYFLSFKKAAKEILSILSSHAKGSDKTEQLSVHTIICILSFCYCFPAATRCDKQIPPHQQAPKDAHIQDPRTWRYVSLPGRGGIKATSEQIL